MVARITVQADGKLLLEDPQGRCIELDPHSAADVLRAQLSALDVGLVDALLQIERDLSPAFQTLLKGVALEKNVVRNSTVYAEGNSHIGDVISYHYYYHHSPPSQSKYLTLEHPESDTEDTFPERTQRLIEEIDRLFREGKTYVVLFGEPGLGKKTLAIRYYHRVKKHYQQIGWIPYQNSLVHSYIKALKGKEEEDYNEPKNDEFYLRLAQKRIRSVRNMPGKKFFVIENVSNWEDVLTYKSHFNIDDAYFLLTAEKPCLQDSRFINLFLPRLTREEIHSAFFRATQVNWASLDLSALKGNAYLLNLLACNTPAGNMKAAKQFIEAILPPKGTDVSVEHIAQNLFRQSQLSAAEQWLLLQMAALLPDNYEPDLVAAYLDSNTQIASGDADPDMDIRPLAGFQNFLLYYSQAPEAESHSLRVLLERLAQKGWLEAFDNEAFAIHPITAAVVSRMLKVDVAFFPELLNSLQLAFFSEEYGLIKDHLIYRQQVERLLSLLPESTDEIYIDLVKKLIAIHHDSIEWEQELICREKLLRLVRQCMGNQSEEAIQVLCDISFNLHRLGRYSQALQRAEEAQQAAEGVIPEGASLWGSIYTVIGLSLKELGEYPPAKDHLEKALLSDERNFGPEHPNTARSYSNLGLVLQDLGDYAGARALLEKALLSDERNFGPEHSTTAVRYSSLGSVLWDLGDYAGARALLEKALLSDERNFGPEHPNTARSYSNLGSVLQDLGDYAGARALLEKALLSDERNFGPEHPTTAASYSNLGSVLRDLGDYAGARALLEKALLFCERNFGPEHPNTARSYSNLGLVLRDLGDYAGARALLEKALLFCERNFGPEHPNTARSYSKLGSVLRDLGDYAGARALLEKALLSFERNFGPEHPNTAVRYSKLGSVLRDLGDYAGARALLEKALLSDERNFGPEHPTTAVRYSNLGLVLRDLGDYAGARALLEKALLSDERNFGPEHPTTAASYSSLGSVLRDLGDYAGARALLEKALLFCERNFGPEHPNTARSYSNLGLVLQDLGDYAGARALLEKALLSDERNFGPEHPDTAVHYSNLGLVLQDLGDYAGARALLEKALLSDERNFGPEHPTTARSYFNLGVLYFEMGQREDGLQLVEKAYSVHRARLGEEHPNTVRVKRMLEEMQNQR